MTHAWPCYRRKLKKIKKKLEKSERKFSCFRILTEKPKAVFHASRGPFSACSPIFKERKNKRIYVVCVCVCVCVCMRELCEISVSTCEYVCVGGCVCVSYVRQTTHTEPKHTQSWKHRHTHITHAKFSHTHTDIYRSGSRLQRLQCWVWEAMGMWACVCVCMLTENIPPEKQSLVLLTQICMNRP